MKSVDEALRVVGELFMVEIIRPINCTAASFGKAE